MQKSRLVREILLENIIYENTEISSLSRTLSNSLKVSKKNAISRRSCLLERGNLICMSWIVGG